MSVQNGLAELRDLFANKKLRVPRFQRAYAWDQDPHLEDFIRDLCDHPAEQQKQYFLGTILLTRSQTQTDSLLSEYHIVDGQQRLTTTCIFIIAACRLLQTEVSTKDLAEDALETFLVRRGRRKFHTIEEDEVFFQQQVLGDSAEGAPDRRSQARLASAKRFFTSQFREFGIEGTAALLAKLLNSVVLVYTVESDLSATQIFELQNDRGKRLTNLEAVKSFLMYGIYRLDVPAPDDRLHQVQSAFANIYRAHEQIEHARGAPDEDSILRYHCIGSERWLTVDGANGWDVPKLWVRRVLEEGAGDPEAQADWITGFSARLQSTFYAVSDVLKSRDDIRAQKGKHQTLGGLFILRRVGPAWPLLLKAWKLDRTENKSQFSIVVEALESFSFFTSLIGRRADAGAAKLAQLARDLSGNFDDLLREISALRQWFTRTDLVKVHLDDQNFYSRDYLATYVLWRYENHLQAARGRDYPRLSWKDVVDPVSGGARFAKDHIEPKNSPRLSEPVRWDESDSAPRPFSEIYLHRLGTLVLDTIAAGSAKSDRPFSERIEHYTNSDFASQREVVERLASRDAEGNPIWDCAAIRKRHEELVRFAVTEL